MPTTRQLPLSPDDVSALTRAIAPRSLDAALGTLAAVVSIPAAIPSQLWLAELIGGAKIESIEDVQRIATIIMALNNFVAEALMVGRPRAFFPDTNDDDACRAFVNAYLDLCASAKVDSEDGDKISQGLAMLVGYARVTDEEMREAGAKHVEAIRTELREGLPEIIGLMHAAWLETRQSQS